MNRTETLNVLKAYTRLKTTLEEDFERLDQRHADLFGQLRMLKNNPSDSDARRRKVEMLESAFSTYKELVNTQRELLDLLDTENGRLINTIEEGMTIDEFIHKNELMD